MGTKGVYKLADWYAKAYFSDYELIHSTSFADLLNEIYQRTSFKQPDDPRSRLGRVVIISHADKQGRFYFPLVEGDKKTYVTPEEIVTYLKEGWLSGGLLTRIAATNVARLADEQTRIDVKGCNFGKNQAAVDMLRDIFGGRVTVTAPKAKVELKNLGYGPGQPFRDAIDAVHWMVMNGYLPPEATDWPKDKKEEFIESLFPAGEDLKGIPSEWLLTGKKKLQPSDPEYSRPENIAISKPK